MCRLMAFVSTDEKSFAEAAGPQFKEFADLSARHGHGWGIASCNMQEHPSLLVEPTRAKDSETFAKASHDLKSNGALLHLRWATGQLAVKDGNTHPFTYNDFSFIHNGALLPTDAINHLVEPKFAALRRGETDSESYFYVVMASVEKHGVEAGLLAAIRMLRSEYKYSSINAMLLTPTELYVVNEHNADMRPDDEPANYYDLFYRNDGNEILVASSGWDQTGWTEIPNHSVMRVDRKSLEVSITNL